MTPDRSFLPDEFRACAADWFQNPVVSGPDLYTPIPSRVRLAWHRYFRSHLSQPEQQALELPRIHGCSHPQWMWDREGNIVVVKDNFSHNHQFRSAPREKICADIAYLTGVPAPPVRLWERRDQRGDTVYSTVSARILRHSHDRPNGAELITSGIMPVVAAFDQYVKNNDRRPDSLVTGTVNNDDEYTILAADNGFSLTPDLRVPIWIPIAYLSNRFDEDVVSHLQSRVFKSQKAEQIVRNIEGLASETLSDVVFRIPTTAFESDSIQGEIENGLNWRRDNLRDLLKSGFARRNLPTAPVQKQGMTGSSDFQL